jgi:hypothetical protein
MENYGWIFLHKCLLDWEWYKDINTKCLFIHCLLKANYSDKEWKGQLIKRGQFFTSTEKLSFELSLSIKQIRTSLKKLEKTKELGIQGASNGTMLTVCKYEDYQNIDIIKGQTKGQTKGKQRANKGQQLKEEEIIIKKEIINIPEFSEFKNYALENKPKIDLIDLELKYKAWVVNGWKNGNDKEIKNWKKALLNTLPFIKEKINIKSIDPTKHPNYKVL